MSEQAASHAPSTENASVGTGVEFADNIDNVTWGPEVVDGPISTADDEENPPVDGS